MQPALYWIETPFPGKLAVSARPRGGDWLEDEVAGWRQAGVDAVASLLTPEEVKDLDLSAEGNFCEAHSIWFRSLPIPDRSIPPSRTDAAKLIESLKHDLQTGRNVTVHCRQGIGRSGLIAAALLVSAGIDPEEAIRRVSQARGIPIPETSEQKDWILRSPEVLAKGNTAPLKP